MKWLHIHGFPPSDENYDFPLWADAFKCAWGIPLGFDGKYLALSMLGKVGEYIGVEQTHLMASSFRHENAVSEWTSRIAIDGDVSNTVDCGEFDVVVIPLLWYLCPYIKWIQSQFPKMRIILIEDDSFQEISLMHPALGVEVVDVVRSAHLVLCYTHMMHKWIHGFQPRSIRASLPLPAIFREFPEWCDSPTSSVCLGIVSWNYDLSNIGSNCVVFSGLEEALKDIYEPTVIGVRDSQWYSMRDLHQYNRIVPDLTLQGWLKGGFYKTLASQQLVLHLTTRVSLGRYAAQCAWTGTPIIGNICCQWQKELWPEISVIPYEVGKARRIATRILQDRTYRDKACRHARSRLRDAFEKQEEDIHTIRKLVEEAAVSRGGLKCTTAGRVKLYHLLCMFYSS